MLFNGVEVPGVWRRDGIPIDDNSTLSNHFTIPFNSTGQGLIGLIITNVGVADNGAELSCVFSGLVTASVTIQVVGMFGLFTCCTYVEYVDTKPSKSTN